MREMMHLLTTELVLRECAGRIINDDRKQRERLCERPVGRTKLEKDAERTQAYRHLEAIRTMMHLLTSDMILFECAGRIITDHRKQPGDE